MHKEFHADFDRRLKKGGGYFIVIYRRLVYIDVAANRRRGVLLLRDVLELGRVPNCCCPVSGCAC